MKVIKNPTRYYRSGVTKARLVVPDYNSVVSKDRRAQDLSLRIASEIKRYNDAGGICIFSTFTYKPSYRPYFSWIDESGNPHSVSCFNKKDKDTYLNSLRCFLYDNFVDFHNNQVSDETNVPEELPFRYVWASEKGHDDVYIDDKGNERTGQSCPHYHVIFFFPPLVWQKILSDQLEPIKYLKSLISRLWEKRGMVRWSDEKPKDPYPVAVTSEFAARYVAKYCTKDDIFLNHPDVKSYLYDGDGNLIKDHYDKIKPYLPFHKTSNHVGESLKYLYNTAEDFRNGVNLDPFVFSSDTGHGHSKLYKAPLYIQRKTLLEYDRVEGRYKYTEFGRKVRVENKMFEFQKSVDKVLFDISPIGISKKLSDDEIRFYFDKYGYENSLQLSLYISSILENRRKVEEFILYNLSWRGRTFDEDVSFMDAYMSCLSFEDFYDESFQLYYQSMENDVYDTYVEEGYFNLYRPSYFFNNLTRFTGFDTVSDLIQLISDSYSDKVTRRYIEDRELRRKLKLIS